MRTNAASLSVFTVSNAVATPARTTSLADERFWERTHLQEWVIKHAETILGGAMVITSEFGRWAGAAPARGSARVEAHDRLDILALDRDGTLVVVELKRGVAPDTADMQALKYAALVSRFTIEKLIAVHAEYLASRSLLAEVTNEIGPSTRVNGSSEVQSFEAQAKNAITSWTQASDEAVSDEKLRHPRIVLIASDFPTSIKSTAVYLYQELDQDVELVQFTAYKTDVETLITFSLLYPPADMADFIIEPQILQQREARVERREQQRTGNAVGKLLGNIEDGTRFSFRPPLQHRAAVETWITEDPHRGIATWNNVAGSPLTWMADGSAYSPTGLTRHILTEVVGRAGAIQGTQHWADDDGRTLVELAELVSSSGEMGLPPTRGGAFPDPGTDIGDDSPNEDDV